jgi:hypothetical protein
MEFGLGKTVSRYVSRKMQYGAITPLIQEVILCGSGLHYGIPSWEVFSSCWRGTAPAWVKRWFILISQLTYFEGMVRRHCRRLQSHGDLLGSPALRAVADASGGHGQLLPAAAISAGMAGALTPVVCDSVPVWADLVHRVAACTAK